VDQTYHQGEVSLLTSAATPIPIGTFKSIIEGSGLSVDDFR